MRHAACNVPLCFFFLILTLNGVAHVGNSGHHGISGYFAFLILHLHLASGKIHVHIMNSVQIG